VFLLSTELSFIIQRKGVTTIDKFHNANHDIIFNSINEGIFTIDLDWRITSFNNAAERITGVPREMAIGRLCYEVFRANICENNCALKQTFKTGNPIINTTAYIIDQAGRQIPIRLSTAILKNKEDIVTGGVETFQDLSQIAQMQKQLEERYNFEDIIGRSPAMMELFEIVPLMAENNSTVLLEGASGTGKELFARAIHNLSPRKKQRFVPVNCAALPDTLLESELFGYQAGAFTGANQDKPGRFALADGGTIFLDEVGDIPLSMQVKLLRVLQEHEIEPLGSIKPLNVDVRVIAATNKDLNELVRTGQFREDLYYRICVLHLKLPALRERRADIPLLVDHLIYKYNRLQGKDIAGISDEVMSVLMKYDFPGNIRELENIIEHSFVLCRGGLIELHHLPPELRPVNFSVIKELGPLTLKAMEKNLIFEALQRHKGYRKQTARELGIDVSTLYRKIKSLGIDYLDNDGRSRR